MAYNRRWGEKNYTETISPPLTSHRRSMAAAAAAADTQDWVWASQLLDIPSSKDILRTLQEIMHDDTPAFRQAGCPFFPLDLLKLMAVCLDYGYPARPLSALSTLLYHPQHPAKLVVEEHSVNGPFCVIYLHVWHEGHATYVRGFHTLFQSYKTPSGIIAYDSRSHSLSVETDHQDDWNILGQTDDFTGVLVDWLTTEIAKDPELYLEPEHQIVPWNYLSTDLQKRITLARMGQRIIQPASVDHPSVCRLQIRGYHHLQVPVLDVLQAGTNQPLYSVPKRDNANESLVSYQERIRTLNLPSLSDLVQPHSVNDVSWLLLGWSVHGTKINHMTHVLQVAQVQPAS
jgi:hypothetical protein